MTDLIELSEDAFAALFKPVANHLNPNASFDWGDGYGTLFETFGKEIDFVLTHELSKIWTLVSGDDGDHVTSGFHFVNRLGYFITETAVPDGVLIQITLEQVEESQSSDSLPPNIVESLQSVLGYLWRDEEKHFQESDKSGRKSHIFQSLKIIRKWLKTQQSTSI